MKTLSTQAEKTERAIELYTQLVYGIALSQLNDRSEADDVYQEVFLLHLDKAIDFKNDEHEKAWLIKTTVNLCKRFNFSPWKLRTVPLEEARFVPAAEEERTVWTALCSLKPKYRLTVYLHYFEGMSSEVIARTLGIKHDTVRKQLQRGREMLKVRLEGDLYE